MTILFIGAVEFSEKALVRILDSGFEVSGVFTSNSSDQYSDYANLSKVCNDRNINCKYYDSQDPDLLYRWIKELEPDLILCFGWSKLLKKEVFNYPKYGTVGFHPASIPMNRGRHPLVWALALGLEETATTFFKMDEGADSGPIISQKKLKILDTDYALDLYKKMTNQALDQLAEFLPNLLNGSQQIKKQNHKEANYWRKRSFEDGIIDWRMSAEVIRNLIRALSEPYPGASFFYKKKEYTVQRAEIVKGCPRNIEPGKILKRTKHTLLVKCGEAAINIKNISPKIEINKGEYL